MHPNDPLDKLLSNESKFSIRHWLLTKSVSNIVRKCSGTRGESSSTTTGFRQRNLANFRKGSSASFVGLGLQQQIFVKESPDTKSDSERLKKLEFEVGQMNKKMNELDLKLDMVLKAMTRPESPSGV